MNHTVRAVSGDERYTPYVESTHQSEKTPQVDKEAYWQAYVNKIIALNKDCLAKKLFIKNAETWEPIETLMRKILTNQDWVEVKATYKNVARFKERAKAYIIEAQLALSEPNVVEEAIYAAVKRLASETGLAW
jgi:hypothetical protein